MRSVTRILFSLRNWFQAATLRRQPGTLARTVRRLSPQEGWRPLVNPPAGARRLKTLPSAKCGTKEQIERKNYRSSVYTKYLTLPKENRPLKANSNPSNNGSFLISLIFPEGRRQSLPNTERIFQHT